MSEVPIAAPSARDSPRSGGTTRTPTASLLGHEAKPASLAQLSASLAAVPTSSSEVSAQLKLRRLPRPVLAQEAATAVYVRTDSDDTTVITPRLRVATELAEGTAAEVAYVVDVWTSASVDVKAAYADMDVTSAASKRITEELSRNRLGAAYVLGPTLRNTGVFLGSGLRARERRDDS